MRQNPQTGFTLIELSIVLVIIGLVVGGVLVGRDLIRAAELRAVVSEIENFQAAINTFETKYGALPGDMPNAEFYWGTASGGCGWGNGTGTQTCNGNGNGLIGASISADNVSSSSNWINGNTFEYFRFWQHLSNAGLIAGYYSGASAGNFGWGVGISVPGVNVPISKGFSNACYTAYRMGDDPSVTNNGYFSGDYGFLFYLGMPQPGGSDMCFNNDSPLLSAIDAMNIDLKMDDGQPATGRVKSFTPNYEPNCATSTDPTLAKYNVTYSSPACDIIFTLIAP